MLLGSRDRCYVTCYYAAEISGIVATLLVATLLRSLGSLLRYLLLRCRDLWDRCYVTCYYAAEISGIVAKLLVTMLLGSRDRCYVTCYYAAEISGIVATLLVTTLLRSLGSLLRYLLLRCWDVWDRCYVTCYYAAWQWRCIHKNADCQLITVHVLQR